MSKKTILSVIGFVMISMVYGAVENPNVDNSFKKRNTPNYSGQRQRFITQGNTYGRSGNDIVSGNVSGGKHFRGVVPYGSSYYSGAYSNSSGSASVNQFIRRSSNPIANDRYPGQVQSYYDPRRSVSSMSRPDGSSGLTNPPLIGQGRKTNPYVTPHTSQLFSTSKYLRPLSVNNTELEQILSRRKQLEETALNKDDLNENENEKKAGFFSDTFATDSSEENPEEPQDSEDDLTPQEHGLTELLKENQKVHDEQILEAQAQETVGPEEPDDKENLALEGRKVLGKHTSFASLADEKHAAFMDAAETFIQKGQFYKAADTYALAIVWKPNDARGYMGQSFSLFAAGEYMSSAYYLSRTFELDPKMITQKYNPADLIANRDVFETRILEMSTWQERSDSGELAFLLAYISYQDNKATRAVEYIRKAYKAMPESSAVRRLKNIIDPDEVLK